MLPIVIALSGASGVTLGIRLLEAIPQERECYAIATDGAHEVLRREKLHNVQWLRDDDIGAKVASGSFLCEAMAIVPCSMNTLGKIASGIADNLTTRAASVCLKERRKLLLAPREMPFSTLALEQMQRLSLYGVLIAPPVAAYYANVQNLEAMERFWVGKWLDLLQIPHNLYERWGG
ncbi:MAG: UbiX family flavin prenyltransferase [Helicobacter sp.]|nr:UbiX family flavin prenyltransferase [Helicobacter sp.]